MYDPRLKRAIQLALQNPADNTMPCMETREDKDDEDEENKDKELIEEYQKKLKLILTSHLKQKWSSFPREQIKTQLEQWQEAGTDFNEESIYYSEIEALLDTWMNENRMETEREIAEALNKAMLSEYYNVIEELNRRLNVEIPTLADLLAEEHASIRKRSEAIMNEYVEKLNKYMMKHMLEQLGENTTIESVINNIEEWPEEDLMIVKITERVSHSRITDTIHRIKTKTFMLLGAKLKKWITVREANVCETCAKNEAQGRIPVKEKFRSGDMWPGAHRMCRCTIRFWGVTHKTLAKVFPHAF